MVNKFMLVLSARRLEAHAVITMKTLSGFPRSQGDFPKDCFLKDGLAKYDVNAIHGVDVQFNIS